MLRQCRYSTLPSGFAHRLSERPTPAPHFETYNARPVPQADTRPIVTITKCGHFLPNPQAFAVLSYAEKMELLFDRTARVIGPRSVPTTTPHALWVVTGKAEAPLDDIGPRTYVIYGEHFVAEHDINHKKKRRYTTDKIADILIIRLQEERESPD